jgi:hypothetical protein
MNLFHSGGTLPSRKDTLEGQQAERRNNPKMIKKRFIIALTD